MKTSCGHQQSDAVFVPQPVVNNQVLRQDGRTSGQEAVSVETETTVVVAPTARVVDATSVAEISDEAEATDETAATDVTKVDPTRVDPTSVDTVIALEAVLEASQTGQKVLVEVIKTVETPMLVMMVVEPAET